MQRRREEQLWLENARDLVRYPSKFWPSRDQSPGGQINALVRLVAYCSLGAFAYNREPRTLLFGAAIIAILTVSYRGSASPTRGSASSSPAGRKCKRPTRDNPFMNKLVTEYGNPEDGEPCAYESVKADVEKNFYNGLPRNIEDVYNTQNSQREFLSLPNGGLPPDTREFAEFLYAGMKNCKRIPGDCDGTR